jgi:putative glycosyltransferase (TIGR04348 family)
MHMKIILITPAKKLSKSGNRTTALRWARILRALGYKVSIQRDWDGSAADMMVAIHAWRSAASIERFRQRFPSRPLLVILSGTDIYSYQHSHPQQTLKSMDLADTLVCLHDRVHQVIPQEFTHKLHVLHQSALPLKSARRPARRSFDICVIGHLREEKDPLRAAYAARHLDEASRLRLFHLGKAYNEEWANAAREEMKINQRYRWLGEVGGWRVRQEFVKTHVMVISSIMEGGANVVSEAVIAGVPILASRIDGNVGLLGEDYPGYYEAKNTEALLALLQRCENEADFLHLLLEYADRCKHLFDPVREQAQWQSLLQKLN